MQPTPNIFADLSTLAKGDIVYTPNYRYAIQRYEFDELSAELGTEDHIISKPSRTLAHIVLEENDALVLWCPATPKLACVPLNDETIEQQRTTPLYYATEEALLETLDAEDAGTVAYINQLTDEQILRDAMQAWVLTHHETPTPAMRDAFRARLEKLSA